MINIFDNDAFSVTQIAAAVVRTPYVPTPLGPGGMNLFDEKPINTLSVIIESRRGHLNLIADTARHAPGDFTAETPTDARPFLANHLRRNAKIFADEVQGVRMFGSEDERLTIEAKRDEKVKQLQDQHAITWEWHRMGALKGLILDADGSRVLRNLYTEFGVSQTVIDFNLSNGALDVRRRALAIQDAMDDALGGSTYQRVHVFAGTNFYDDLVNHAYVSEVLKNTPRAVTLLEDNREGFTLGGVTWERARRWRVKSPEGVMLDMIAPNEAYAFPVGAMGPDGPLFIGRFAPQPYLDTVNRLNPPLVIKTVKDPSDRWLMMEGVSCPLYLNTRPDAVIKLTKS